MKRIDVTHGVFIEVLGPDEAQDPIVYIVFDDYPDSQSVPIFAKEIKVLIEALVEAGVYLADQVGGE